MKPIRSRLQQRVWVPIGFTALYLAGAWLAGYYGNSGSWETLARAIGVAVALVFVALPSTLLIWLLWARWSLRETAKPLGMLLITGLAIPFVVAAVEYAIFAADAAFKKSRTTHQLAGAHLSAVTDEALLSAQGNPIGIRLRYTIRLDEGLDDVRYLPILSLGFEPHFIAMTRVRSDSDPVVTDNLGKHEYRFTEDFVPGYFPGFLRFPGVPQRADDRCFYWGRPADRQLARDTTAEHATINISFATSPEKASVNRVSSTAQAYAQEAFYNGARAEGARDCP